MNDWYSLTETKNGYEYIDRSEKLRLTLDKDRLSANMIEAGNVSAGNSWDIFPAALNQPLGTKRLSELAKGRRNACILVSDATRAVCTAEVLPYVIDELEKGGISCEQITLIVAIGVHRDATADEMRRMCGSYYGQVKIYNHDPYSADQLVYLGTTSFGTEVRVNRRAWEADLRISIGKVEPHEFAGFSGGRKSVLPGIAAESTIVHNHRPEMILNPRALPGVLEGNPVHMDMLETAEMLGIDFCVSVIQDQAGLPIQAFAGSLRDSHEAAVEYLRGRFSVRSGAEANIFLTTPGRPLNIDLYQSLKAIIAITPALKAGDVIVMYSACTEGINSEDMMRPFQASSTLEGAIEYLMKNYKIQMDHALLLCKILQIGVHVVACCPGVADSALELMHFTPCAALDEAIETALRLSGVEHPRMLVCPAPQRLIF